MNSDSIDNLNKTEYEGPREVDNIIKFLGN